MSRPAFRNSRLLRYCRLALRDRGLLFFVCLAWTSIERGLGIRGRCPHAFILRRLARRPIEIRESLLVRLQNIGLITQSPYSLLHRLSAAGPTVERQCPLSHSASFDSVGEMTPFNQCIIEETGSLSWEAHDSSVHLHTIMLGLSLFCGSVQMKTPPVVPFFLFPTCYLHRLNEQFTRACANSTASRPPGKQKLHGPHSEASACISNALPVTRTYKFSVQLNQETLCMLTVGATSAPEIILFSSLLHLLCEYRITPGNLTIPMILLHLSFFFSRFFTGSTGRCAILPLLDADAFLSCRTSFAACKAELTTP